MLSVKGEAHPKKSFTYFVLNNWTEEDGCGILGEYIFT